MRHRTITIREVPETTLRVLRARARATHRSLNGELLSIIEAAAREPAPSGAARVAEPVPERYVAAPLNHAALADICRRHHIRSLAVFGSHARGEARPDSDVDVLVEFEPGMTPGLGIVRVAEALRPVFGGRQVDLVTRRGMAPRLRERILAEAVPLHGA